MDGSAIATRARASLERSGCFSVSTEAVDVGSAGGKTVLEARGFWPRLQEDAAFAFPAALVSHHPPPSAQTTTEDSISLAKLPGQTP